MYFLLQQGSEFGKDFRLNKVGVVQQDDDRPPEITHTLQAFQNVPSAHVVDNVFCPISVVSVVGVFQGSVQRVKQSGS